MTIEQLRDNYYDAISLLNNEEDIINALPKTTYPNGYSILWGVIDRIKNDIALYEEMKNDTTNKEDIEVANKLIEVSNFKIDICTELILSSDEIDDDNTYSGEKHLIFGTLGNGNAFYERDLKDFSQATYPDIINCLNYIKDGSSDNIEKGRSFNKNNRELAGCKESKSYQARVLYYNIACDCAFVFLMYEKKEDKSTYLSNLMKVRKNYFVKEIAELKEALKNPEKRHKIIEENEIVEETLRSILGATKKPRKGNK